MKLEDFTKDEIERLAIAIDACNSDHEDSLAGFKGRTLKGAKRGSGFWEPDSWKAAQSAAKKIWRMYRRMK